jgi:hypothetical protein
VTKVTTEIFEAQTINNRWDSIRNVPKKSSEISISEGFDKAGSLGVLNSPGHGRAQRLDGYAIAPKCHVTRMRISSSDLIMRLPHERETGIASNP